MWPALWMMPEEDFYGGWSASGEIDIMEINGARPKLTSSALHYSAEWPDNRFVSSGFKEIPDTCVTDDGFHNFVFTWDSSVMTFSVDGRETWRVDLDRDWHEGGGRDPYNGKGQPWDRSFYFIFNVAVGGWFVEDPVPGDSGRWETPDMLVDYVKVEQRR